MTKRSRTILFSILGTVFVAVTPTILLYSQGYRFDWRAKTFAQVGAFYFDITPDRASVYVDNVLIGTTAPFVGTTLTKNFAPNTYEVTIQKSGYTSWRKNLEIFPKQVTEAKNIILFPENLTFLSLLDNVDRYWLSPDKREAIIQQKLPRGVWELSLWDTERNILYPLFDSARFQDTVEQIVWAPDASRFFLQVQSREQLQNYIQQINRSALAAASTTNSTLKAAASARTSLDSFIPNAIDVQFASFSPSQIYFTQLIASTVNVYQGDYLNEEKTVLAKDIVVFVAQRNRILWLDTAGKLWQQENDSLPDAPLNENAFPVQKEVPHTILVFQDEIFLQENDILYYFDPQSSQFVKLFSSAREILESPDGTKLAIGNGSEIWIRFLRDTSDQPKHQKGDHIFLTRFGKPIHDINWINQSYLAFATGDDVKITEVDERDQVNIVDIRNAKGAQLFWQDAPKLLYLIDNGTILVSEKLF